MNQKTALLSASGLALPRSIVGRGVRADASDPKAMIAALNNAFQSFTGGATSNQHPRDAQHDADMHRDKIAPSLDIVVNSDTLVLRGTGVDVDPALLSGNVVLNLTEPTSLKEIVLQFRGKARLPVSASEP